MSPIIGTPILFVNRNANLFAANNIGMSIGSRIREARKRAKLTQEALRVKVGISQGALSELETGESAGTTMIASFADALGVSALWLETGRGPMQAAGAPALTLVKKTPLPDGVFYDLVTEDERKLVALYRTSTERGKQTIMLNAEVAEKEDLASLKPTES